MVRIKKSKDLAKRLYGEAYDKIYIYNDGHWNKTGEGTPRLVISRSRFYNVTKTEVGLMLKAVRNWINGVYSQKRIRFNNIIEAFEYEKEEMKFSKR